MTKNAVTAESLNEGLQSIVISDKITKEIIISISLHFIIVFLFIFFPPFLMQIKEPAVTEVTLINTIDPIPIPSIKEEMQSPSPAPAPVIQKAAPKIPKIKGIPEPKEGITDEPVKDIGRIGLPRRSDIGRKEMASFSKKALGTDDVPLPDRSFIEGGKGMQTALPTNKKGEAAGSSESFGIKGSAGKRKLIFRPSPPSVDTSVTVTIELEFRILSDGSVVDIMPVRKADAKLEEIAIRYLKNWRFNSVSDDEKDEYVGIVPIKFKVR
ncbi:MAG: hypothetical protein AABY58_05750 [Nitrospirota bacterium]